MVARLERRQVRMDGRTIERVAIALANWATPGNEWSYFHPDTQERWRNAARTAIGAIDQDKSKI